MDLLHAANLRHGTDGFTSPPKEGVLRIFFFALKIRRLRPGLNPRTWVLKASTLPLDHRSPSTGRHTAYFISTVKLFTFSACNATRYCSNNCTFRRRSSLSKYYYTIQSYEQCLFFRNSPQLGQGLLIFEVSRSHTTTHHSR